MFDCGWLFITYLEALGELMDMGIKLLRKM